MDTKFLLAALLVWALPTFAQAQQAPSAAQCAAAWSGAVETGDYDAVATFVVENPSCAEIDEARQYLTTPEGEAALARAEAAAEPARRDDEGSGRTGGIIGAVVGSVIGGPRPASEPPAPGAPSPPPAPPSTSTAPGFAIPAERTVYIPAGRLLLRGQAMIAEGGGYGVILLRRGAPENLAACQIFVRSLGFTQQRDDGLVEQVDGSFVYRRPIYWPTLHAISATRADDCRTMLANYDYDRAAIMLTRLRTANRVGPFMVIWRADGRAAGVFDYSGINQVDLDRQFDRSLFELSQSDQIWQASFYERAGFERRLRELIAGVASPARLVAATLINFQPPTFRISQ